MLISGAAPDDGNFLNCSPCFVRHRLRLLTANALLNELVFKFIQEKREGGKLNFDFVVVAIALFPSLELYYNKICAKLFRAEYMNFIA